MRFRRLIFGYLRTTNTYVAYFKIYRIFIVFLFNCNTKQKNDIEKDRIEKLYIEDYLKGDIKEITRSQYEVETVFNEINKTKSKNK